MAHHLILLAKDQEGYANLCYLSSTAYLNGFYVDKQVLSERSKGLVALTAYLGGEITNACYHGELDRARSAAVEYRDIFGDGNCFLEGQSNGFPEQEKANEHLKQLSQATGILPVATADAHYIGRPGPKAGEGKMHDAKRQFHGSSARLVATLP